MHNIADEDFTFDPGLGCLRHFGNKNLEPLSKSTGATILNAGPLHGCFPTISRALPFWPLGIYDLNEPKSGWNDNLSEAIFFRILLPFVCHLQYLQVLCRGLSIVGEEIVHVLFKTVIVELSSLFDFTRHLFLYTFNVIGRPVRIFERLPGVQKSNSLIYS